MNHQKFLTEDEYSVLWSKIQNTDSRESLLFGLLLVTGARCGEILRLDVADINKDDTAVFIRGSKGSLDRTMPLQPWLFDRLIRYVGQRRGRVFDIGYRRLNYLWRDFRPSPKRLHSLRHTFAVRGYRRTKDIRLIQGCLGHKWLSTTMIYQTAINSVEERRAGLE